MDAPDFAAGMSGLLESGHHLDVNSALESGRHPMVTMPISGGCFCGAIRWEGSNVFDAGYCHCSICRRMSGAPVFSFVHFREGDFRLTKGSPRPLPRPAALLAISAATVGLISMAVKKAGLMSLSVSAGLIIQLRFAPRCTNARQTGSPGSTLLMTCRVIPQTRTFLTRGRGQAQRNFESSWLFVPSRKQTLRHPRRIERLAVVAQALV